MSLPAQRLAHLPSVILEGRFGSWILPEHRRVLIAGPARQFRAAEWVTDLRECACPLKHAWSLVGASLRMRLADLTGLGKRAASWLLCSQIRTWGLLIPLMVAALDQVRQSQGGAAVWTLFTVAAVVDLVGRLMSAPISARMSWAHRGPIP
jgi:hypothetical protein